MHARVQQAALTALADSNAFGARAFSAAGADFDAVERAAAATTRTLAIVELGFIMCKTARKESVASGGYHVITGAATI